MRTLTNPHDLVATYSARAPNGFEELLDSEVATIEQTFLLGRQGFMPFLFLLDPAGKLSRCDLRGPALQASDRELWGQILPAVVRRTRAQCLGLGVAESAAHPLNSELVHLATCHAVGADGQHHIAQCQVQPTPGQPLRRLTDWWAMSAHEAPTLGDVNALEVVAALRDVDAARPGSSAATV